MKIFSKLILAAGLALASTAANAALSLGISGVVTDGGFVNTVETNGSTVDEGFSMVGSPLNVVLSYVNTTPGSLDYSIVAAVLSPTALFPVSTFTGSATYTANGLTLNGQRSDPGNQGSLNLFFAGANLLSNPFDLSSLDTSKINLNTSQFQISNVISGGQFNDDGSFSTIHFGDNFTGAITGVTTIGASAVPETTTWIMMIFGIGFTGGMLRTASQRRKLVLA